MSNSLTSFLAPKIPAMPSTASVPQEVQYAWRALKGYVDGLPNFSIFSWTTPESNVTAQYPALGFNLAPNSVASTLWVKTLGSGTTGWVAIA
jgi:hypothetical protein